MYINNWLNKSKKIDFIEKKRLWWKFEGQYIISDLRVGIKNLIKWFPIIWKDKDWDHNYIYTILKSKLKFQSECLSNYNRYECTSRNVQVINLCIKLIDRVQEDYYGMEYNDYHKSTMDFIPCTEERHKGHFEIKTEIISENFDDYFNKYPLIYKKVKIKYPRENRKGIAFHISKINSQRCKKLLFKILENNIEKWWD